MSNDNVELGASVPPYTPHAISVSLPTWRDNVGYEEGETRVADKMVSGYPRFFIHLSIRKVSYGQQLQTTEIYAPKLATVCEQKYAVGNEKCMLFPTRKIAEDCRSFIQRRSTDLGAPVTARLVQLVICPEDTQNDGSPAPESRGNCAELHIALLPETSFPVAKEFWQHTGLGISSRFAERCLSLLPKTSPVVEQAPNPIVKALGRRYAAVKTPAGKQTNGPPVPTSDETNPDLVYLEERYGRNLPQHAAALAKQVLRLRVAGILVKDNGPSLAEQELVDGPSVRGIASVSADDVYLYPSGMSAIWSAHNLALSVLPPAKSVCFGFPYADTLKVLQKWGPGCHFLGFGVDSDIDELEKILATETECEPEKPPIVALFTEFPSNPLLRSANMPRLRALADKYDFLIVVDETVGNFVNVEVFPYADILVSSLTKVFSGASNVMGGSLILNPQGRHYAALKGYMNSNFEDVYFNEDAIFMERNSRDFKRRVRVIDANSEAVCDFLRSKSLAGGAPPSNTVIKEVYYPKYISRENYDVCRIKTPDAEDGEEGGFGGLFSLTFTSKAASEAFFDGLPCYKGPSLGTNFTLACPFTILAHYWELDWAAKYGVEEGLVRISVGMEDRETLLRSFEVALRAAENTISAA